MTRPELDRRIHAYRPDLADIRLRGKVAAEHFTKGKPSRVSVAVAGLHRSPSSEAPLDTQAVRGEPVTVFEHGKYGWDWVQLGLDGYVGWMEASAMGGDPHEPTHRVCVPRTLVFSEPDIKSPLVEILPLGAAVCVVDGSRDHNAEYALIEPNGAVVSQHVMPVSQHLEDYVSVAERLIDTPYLFGGTTAFGLDCSALIQIAMRMTGRNIMRDADMQEGSVGTLLAKGSDLADLQRGDLIFWKGHCGIMLDAENLLHANAHHMAVAAEPLSEAIGRISQNAGLNVTSARRP